MGGWHGRVPGVQCANARARMVACDSAGSDATFVGRDRIPEFAGGLFRHAGVGCINQEMERRDAKPMPPASVHCPACGAAINGVSAGTRKRRVQCPKCRVVVELGGRNEEPASLPAPVSNVPTDAESRERIATLEERVAKLEKAIEALASQPVTTVEAAPKWKWITPSESHEDASVSAEIADALLHNLAAFDRHAIAIQSATGNEHARQRADGLKVIFERARWKVAGPHDVEPRTTDSGLFLAVGTLPVPEEAAAAHFAMTASGFHLQSVLDSNIADHGTILIVA